MSNIHLSLDARNFFQDEGVFQRYLTDVPRTQGKILHDMFSLQQCSFWVGTHGISMWFAITSNSIWHVLPTTVPLVQGMGGGLAVPDVGIVALPFHIPHALAWSNLICIFTSSLFSLMASNSCS